jgi:hypothetical protein
MTWLPLGIGGRGKQRQLPSLGKVGPAHMCDHPARGARVTVHERHRDHLLRSPSQTPDPDRTAASVKGACGLRRACSRIHETPNADRATSWDLKV